MNRGSDWLAFSYNGRTGEILALKQDGGLWKWRGRDNYKNTFLGQGLKEKLLEAAEGRLIPDRFRPERVGFLDPGSAR